MSLSVIDGSKQASRTKVRTQSKYSYGCVAVGCTEHLFNEHNGTNGAHGFNIACRIAQHIVGGTIKGDEETLRFLLEKPWALPRWPQWLTQRRRPSSNQLQRNKESIMRHNSKVCFSFRCYSWEPHIDSVATGLRIRPVNGLKGTPWSDSWFCPTLRQPDGEMEKALWVTAPLTRESAPRGSGQRGKALQTPNLISGWSSAHGPLLVSSRPLRRTNAINKQTIPARCRSTNNDTSPLFLQRRSLHSDTVLTLRVADANAEQMQTITSAPPRRFNHQPEPALPVALSNPSPPCECNLQCAQTDLHNAMNQSQIERDMSA